MILPAEGRDENGAGFGRTGQYGVTRTRLREVLEEAEGWDIVHISGRERHRLVRRSRSGHGTSGCSAATKHTLPEMSSQDHSPERAWFLPR